MTHIFSRLTIFAASVCIGLSARAQPITKATLRQTIQHTLDTAHINGGIAIMGIDFKDSVAIQNTLDTAHINGGIAIAGIDFQDSLTINGNEHYPMESVYKFPQAIVFLQTLKTFQNHGPLEWPLNIPRSSLDADTWSPMLKDFPGETLHVTTGDLLKYSVGKSDNNACDYIFTTLGGPKAANEHLHNFFGVSGMELAATEAQMKADWQAQYSNWCQPYAMAQLLNRFYKGALLPKWATKYLLGLMTNSENPADRILGGLPPGTIVAHKTGTSGTNKEGLTGGTNDVGIITLPNGRHYALVVYLSNYYGSTQHGAQTIAAISKLVWDYYTAKQ